MAIINFMGYWNEVAISTLMLTDANLRTINIGVLMTNTQTGIMNYSYVFALLVLSAVPTSSSSPFSRKHHRRHFAGRCKRINLFKEERNRSA